MTERVRGYWDSADTEIDLVALDEPDRRIRFGSCKRSEEKLRAGIGNFTGQVDRSLASFPQYRTWTIERVALAPVLGSETRRTLAAAGFLAQDLADLTCGL